MKSQKSRAKKAEKAQARRKDFVKRRNINRNVPTKLHTEKIDTFQPKKTREGKTVFERDRMVVGKGKKAKTINTLRPVMEVSGQKSVTSKIPVYRNRHTKGQWWEPKRDETNRKIGMTGYPMSKKFTKSRAEKEALKTKKK